MNRHTQVLIMKENCYCNSKWTCVKIWPLVKLTTLAHDKCIIYICNVLSKPLWHN